jgi:hypothetical protein
VSNARAFALAAAAATAATCGDLMQLWVGNSMRVDMHLVQPPEIVLTIGSLLGCLAIPLYAMGYLAVARTVRPYRPRPATIIAVGGTAFAVTGAITHGLTWVAIRASIAAGTASADPLEAVAASTGPLLDAWVAAAVLMLIVSIAIAWSGFFLPRALPKWLALLNPVNATLIVSAFGAVTELGRAFVVPAAPNIAHIVFFVAALYASMRSMPDGADRTR